MRIGALLYPERNYWRPKTRGDCDRVPRPCPYSGCRFNNFMDASETSLVFNFPDLEPWDVPPDRSCTLDMAETRHTLEEVGAILNLTRERVRQIEVIALSKLASDEVARR